MHFYRVKGFSWKALALGLGLAGVLALALFRHSFVGFGLELALKSFMPGERGAQCRYERMVFREGALVFEGLEVDLPEVGVCAERVAVGFRFDWGRFEMLPRLELKRPVIELRDLKLGGEGRSKGLYGQAAQRLALSVSDGEVRFNKQRAFFNFDGTAFSFASSREGLVKPSMRAAVSAFNGEILTHIDFMDVDLGWLGGWLSLVESGDRFVQLTGGRMEGRALLSSLPRGGLSRMDVQLDARGVLAREVGSDGAFAIKEVNFSGSYPVSGDKRSFTRDKWWNYLLIDGEIIGGRYQTPDLTVDGLEGRVLIDARRRSEIDLRALLEKEGEVQQVVVKGRPWVSACKLLEMQIDFTPLQSNGKEAHAFLCFKDLGEGFEVETNLSNVESEHLQLLQKVVGRDDIELKEGILGGHVRLQFDQGRLSLVQAQSFSAEGVHLISRINDTTLFCSRMSGEATIEMDGDHLVEVRHLGADVKNGDLVFSGGDGVRHSVSDVRGHIGMEGGRFIESMVSGRAANTNVKVEITGDRGCPQFHFFWLVEKDEIRRLLSGFCDDKMSVCDELFVQATLSEDVQGWHLEGKIELENELEELQKIEYGCRFRPFALKRDLGDLQRQLRASIFDGWIKGKRLSNQVYQPIINQLKMDFQLIGYISVDGTFDGEGFYCDYRANHLSYRSEDVDIDMGVWKERTKEARRIKGELTYIFDDEAFTVHMPVIGAKCVFKPLALEFEELVGDLRLKENRLVVDGLHGYSEGIDMEGEIALEFSGIDPISFAAKVPKFAGSAQQALSFARHFPESADVHVPLEGKVQSKGEGLSLFVDIAHPKEIPQWSLAFTLLEGEIETPLHLCKIELQADWHSESGLLLIDQLHACVAGESDLHLSAPHIGLQLLKSPHLVFDFRLENAQYDLMRFTGEGGVGENGYAFQLDKTISHLFGKSIERCEAHFDAKGQLLDLDCCGQLPLLDLQQLLESQHLISHLPQLAGSVNFSYQYGADAAGLKFGLKSDWIDVGERRIKQVALRLEGDRDQLHLRQCDFGDFKAMAELSFSKNELALHEGTVEMQGSFFTIEEGKYQIDEKELHLVVDSLQAGGALLDQFLPQPLQGRGKTVDGRGVVDITSQGVSALINASTNLFFEEGVQAATGDPLKLSMTFDGKMAIKGGTVDLIDEATGHPLVHLSLPHVSLSSNYEIEQLAFTLAPESICFFAEQPLFNQLLSLPQSFDKNIFSHLEKLEGEIDHKAGVTTLRLAEGYYWLSGLPLALSDFCTTFAPDKIQLDCKAQFEGAEINLSATTYPSDKKRSRITLSSHDRGEELHLVWSRAGIHEVEGEILGVQVSLLPKYALGDCEKMILTGKCQVIPSRIGHLFPKLHALKTIDSPVSISGELVIDKLSPLLSYFDGAISARNMAIGNIGWEGILGNLHLSQDTVTFQRLRAADSAGIAIIDDLRFYREEGQWMVDCPKLEINDFKPSLLTNLTGKRPRKKPFKVNILIIEDFKGPLSNLEALTGKGSLQFLNTNKREYSLLDVPIEIISRLGLDFNLLVPIEGEIDFEILDGKIFLTELKNSFSEGKRSYFFFNKKSPSYITLTGDLHIDLNMKQYVLLKITQPFTLSIRGSLDSPEYGLK